MSLSRGLTWLLAFAVGVDAANLYYTQPLTAPMALSLGLSPESAGLVTTLTQVGYGLGVLFLVPLGDLLENRRVILTLLSLAVLALFAIGLATTLTPYFIAAFILGIGVSSVQLIVPFAAHLSAEKTRGAVVGSLMSGLMLGIMLSRPIAGIVGDLFSWHAVFFTSATLMMVLIALLYFKLPTRHPRASGLHYGNLLLSMASLIFRYSVLRRRAIYQACMFAAFCLFWTASPLLLAGPEFHMSQSAIAVFALVGVSGAVFAPLAGRMADRGFTQRGSAFAFIAGILAFAITHLVPLGSLTSLVLLTLAAILLDAGVSANLVLGQRAIFALPSELRGRINSIYIATIFIGGAFGSFIGAWASARGGWWLASWIGCALPLVGFIYFLTESRSRLQAQAA